MLTQSFQFCKYERLFKLGSLVLLGLIFLVPSFAIVSHLLTLRGEEVLEFAILPKESLRMQAARAVANGVWVPSPKVGEKLLYLEHSHRPDSTVKNILLGLKGSSEKKVISEGERVYIRSKDLDDVAFSNEPTPYWIEAKSVTDEKLEVYFTTMYEENHKKVYENSEPLFLPKISELNREDRIFDQLAEMRIYPSDRLIDLYGGGLFENEKGCFRLDVGGEIFFFREGDRLALSGGKWIQGRETQGLPLLLIKSINNQKCEYVAWSGDGYHSKGGFFPIERSLPMAAKASDIFSKIYPRTGGSVTCQVNQKNMVLREGDWLLKTKTGWRNISTLSEIKKLLSLGLKGELFVVDGLEKRDGNTYFVGHLFDEKRTQAQKVELLLTEKKDRKISKKRVSLNE